MDFYLVFPAHAGMIPTMQAAATWEISVPRACGDDPCLFMSANCMACVFPAHAGMIPRSESIRTRDIGVPRACGDDPPPYGLY